MTGFNHTLAGAIIAVTFPAPFVPLAALFSHFFLDVMPHFGRHRAIKPGSSGLRKLIYADGTLSVLALIFSLVLFPDKWFLIGVGTFLSIFPDLQWIFKRQLRTPERYIRWMSAIQWGERPWGWILELAYAAIFVSILIYLS